MALLQPQPLPDSVQRQAQQQPHKVVFLGARGWLLSTTKRGKKKNKNMMDMEITRSARVAGWAGKDSMQTTAWTMQLVHSSM